MGNKIRTNKLYEVLKAAKDSKLLESIPSGRKSNLTFLIERKNFQHGPGAVVDDKAPYTGGHGSNCFAYCVFNDRFVRAHDKYISTSESFTYRNENDEEVPVDDNWIIIWSSMCKRKRQESILKRNVTYFITKGMLHFLGGKKLPYCRRARPRRCKAIVWSKFYFL